MNYNNSYTPHQVSTILLRFQKRIMRIKRDNIITSFSQFMMRIKGENTYVIDFSVEPPKDSKLPKRKWEFRFSDDGNKFNNIILEITSYIKDLSYENI